MPEEHPQRPWLQLIFPISLWAGAFFFRPWLFRGGCAVYPAECSPESLPPFDAWSLGFASVPWDFASNVLQNSTGGVLAIACFMPFLRSRTRSKAFESFTNLRQALVAVAWNGALVEIVRDLVQRPRPLVFTRPMEEGLNPMQFTSFYSGHTSFVALATTLLALKFAPQKYRRYAGILAILMTSVVAAARVLGGRHFPSDVFVGALAGMTVAWSFLTLENRSTRNARNY
jgi:membrane-associated phospholipid phosphatase